MSHTHHNLGLKVILLWIALILLFSAVQLPPQVYATTYTVTYTYDASAYDGTIYASNANYTTAHNQATGTIIADPNLWVGQANSSGFSIYRSFLIFDTTNIPTGATINSANMSIYVDDSLYGSFNLNLTLQGDLSIYPHTPLQTSDYFKNYYGQIAYLRNLGSKNITNAMISTRQNITLNTNGRSFIAKGSLTKFALRTLNDINTVKPASLEYMLLGQAEYGAPARLYINFSLSGYEYIVHGPYYEDGTVYPGIVNLTLFRTTNIPLKYTLNGSDGIADIVTIVTEAVPSHFSWNVSVANETRTYFLNSDFEELWIHVLDTSAVNGYYSFTVHDLVGVTDAYLETRISVNGVEHVVERQSLNVVNSVLFVMAWGHRYKMVLTCDKGTHSYGDFIPLSEASQTLYIMPSYFPVSTTTTAITVNASRTNSTTIEVIYVDPGNQTAWVQVNIKYRSGLTWATAYTTNNTGYTQTITWAYASNNTDYLANINAKWNSSVYAWNYQLPANVTGTNPWTNIFSMFGDMPFVASNLFAFLIVILTLGYGSYEDQYFAYFVALIEAAVLWGIGWYTTSIGSLALGFIFAFLVWFVKGKERQTP